MADQHDTREHAVSRLLKEGPKVVNVGLEGFAADLESQGVPTVHVQWTPPRNTDGKLAALLDKLGS